MPEPFLPSVELATPLRIFQQERDMGQNIVIIPYPDIRAGKPITGQPTSSSNVTYNIDASSTANVYAPFASQMDWDIAKWAKLRGLSSTAFTDLLSIDGVHDSAKYTFDCGTHIDIG